VRTRKANFHRPFEPFLPRRLLLSELPSQLAGRCCGLRKKSWPSTRSPVSEDQPTRLSITPVRFHPQQRHPNQKPQFSPRTPFAPSMNSAVDLKTVLCWKRRQHKLCALADSLRDGASKPDVSGIKTAIAKHRSQKFSRSPIQPKEEPDRSRQTAHCVPQPTFVTTPLYIRAARLKNVRPNHLQDHRHKTLPACPYILA
jgi:hypothetical protein